MRTVIVVILALSAGLAACRDLAGPTEVGTGSEGDAHLAVQVGLATAPEVAQVRLHVMAPDLPDTLRFALSIQDGEARGTAVVPAGPQRTFTLQALDASQMVRYEGSTTMDLVAGPNPPLTIVMTPVEPTAEVPIVGQFGSYTVELAPAADTIVVGQTVRLAATVRDPWGNLVSGALPMWVSSAPGIATVDANGDVTGRAAGRATITARFAGATASALVDVVDSAPPPIGPAPGTVTDLAVASISTNSVTLSFTEVSDGAGSPASYDIRFAVAPISWGSAEQVYEGTCSIPVVGSSIGTERTCTVQGLAASTAYQFQLVAFRGSLDIDAVFGALSNVASATTGTSTAPVASVSVSPASTTVGLGRTQQLSAILEDASGNTLAGRPVTWSSSLPLIATVSSSGLVTGILEGTAIVTATSEGKSGTASVTVSAIGPSLWPNEPLGLDAVRDAPFDVVPPSTGWNARYNEDNLATVVADAGAPHSPSNVLQFRYPQGFVGGSAPATIYASGLDAKEYFVGMWWKPSNPWHGHSSSVNKIMFFYTASGAATVLTMYGPNGGPYYVRAITQGMPSSGAYLTQNVNVVPVALGQWHRIELYMKYDSYFGAGDGVIRWWVDGILVGNHMGLAFPNDGGFTEFQLSPTWGGINGTKAQTDYFWYDHVYLSRR